MEFLTINEQKTNVQKLKEILDRQTRLLEERRKKCRAELIRSVSYLIFTVSVIPRDLASIVSEYWVDMEVPPRVRIEMDRMHCRSRDTIFDGMWAEIRAPESPELDLQKMMRLYALQRLQRKRAALNNPLICAHSRNI